MKDRQYTQAVKGYIDEILLVGINYNKQNTDKSHNCVIERIEKLK